MRHILFVPFSAVMLLEKNWAEGLEIKEKNHFQQKGVLNQHLEKPWASALKILLRWNIVWPIWSFLSNEEMHAEMQDLDYQLLSKKMDNFCDCLRV